MAVRVHPREAFAGGSQPDADLHLGRVLGRQADAVVSDR
jgi:hypothetical protein